MSCHQYTDKKENKISSCIRKFRMSSCKVIYEKMIPNTVYEEMRNYLTIYIRRPLVIYDFATAPF